MSSQPGDQSITHIVFKRNSLPIESDRLAFGLVAKIYGAHAMIRNNVSGIELDSHDLLEDVTIRISDP